MLITSVKTNLQITQNYFGLNPPVHWEYYAEAFDKVRHYLINSVFISGFSVIGVVLVSCSSAYVFARYEFFGKKLLFIFILSFLMIPSVLTLIPQFIMITRMHLINSKWGCILPYIAGGQIVTIYVLRTFFEGLPNELFECARIDGAGGLRCFLSIALPLSIPMVISMGLFNILFTWNDFFWPLLVLPEQEKTTITVGLYRFMDEQQIKWGLIFAGFMIASLPIMFLFSLSMRYFVQGMTSGALKA